MVALPRRNASFLLDQDLLKQAEDMHIDLTRAAEAGIARAVEAERRARRWAEENPDVVRSTNEYVEKHGLPLQKYRAR